MIDRLILSAVLGTAGWHGLNPELVVPTPITLKERAHDKSISGVCLKPKKPTPAVRALCERWKKHKETV